MGWKYFRMVNLFERSNENKLWIKNKVKEKRKEEIIMTERMKEIVAEALNVEIETLKEDTSFKEDLGADSLDLFELVMAFEEEFGVEIPSEDLEKITNDQRCGGIYGGSQRVKIKKPDIKNENRNKEADNKKEKSIRRKYCQNENRNNGTFGN